MNVLTADTFATILESLRFSEDRIRNYNYQLSFAEANRFRIEQLRKIQEAKDAIRILRDTTKISQRGQ